MSSSSSSSSSAERKRGRAESPVARPSKTSRTDETPAAPTLALFLAPGGSRRYRPQAAWLAANSHTALAEPALWTAIRESATEAALALLAAGAPFSTNTSPITSPAASPVASTSHHPVTKGITPLVLAAQKGQLAVVQALLDRGAHPAVRCAGNGATALLQAAHFGHADVVGVLLAVSPSNDRVSQSSSPSSHSNRNTDPDTSAPPPSSPHPLVEMANLNLTTPLMRAAQEGHASIVQALLQAGAQVNRRNHSQMSALMLASQRGHATICQLLIAAGAALDARTQQNSTSLLVACKRSHVHVVRVLVQAGCELWVRDRRGRTAKHVVSRRLHEEQQAVRRAPEGSVGATAGLAPLQAMMELMDSSVQRHLMRCQGRQRRSLTMISHWYLLQQERALVWLVPPLAFGSGAFTTGHSATMSLAKIVPLLDTPVCSMLRFPCTKALLRTMTLPAPLVQLIASFMPLPLLWERTIGMLSKRATLHPDETVTTALDLVDEILEEVGLVEAMDQAGLKAPQSFGNWREWKAYGRCKGEIRSERSRTERPGVTLAVMPPPATADRPSLLEHRRTAAFLSVMAGSPSLGRVLQSASYQMPAGLWAELIRTSDLASLVRRMGSNSGIHFDSTVAMDLVMLASRLCSWHWRRSVSFAQQDGDRTFVTHNG